MRVVAFDCETVPDLLTAERLWGIDPNAPDAFEQVGTIREAETQGRDRWPKHFMHRVVAVGLVGIDFEKMKVSMVADAGTAETALLSLVETWLKGRPVLVSWNGLGYDLAVLRYRALHHGLSMPTLYSGAKKWEKYDDRYGDQHLDLMDRLAGHDRWASAKLEEIAALCDMTAKIEGHGEDVLPLWKAGNYEQLRAKVLEDARDTARIYLRWCLSRGQLSAAELATLDQALVPATRPQLELAAP